MKKSFNIQEVSWDDIREEVNQVNPELAEICDQLDASKKHSLLMVEYPYGALVVDNGTLCLPNDNGDVVPLINNSNISEGLKGKLSYSAIPLSLVLTKSNEVFIEADNRVIPLNFFTPGDLFGLFETVNLLTSTNLTDTSPIWSVSAGARSVFMVPKISDSIGHNKLKREYGISADVPKNHLDQWKVFADINKKSESNATWSNTILIFTNGWFEKKNDVSISKFHNYLVKQAWLQIKLLKDYTAYSTFWLSFTHEINNLNLKPRGYLVDTIKHLTSIATNRGIGFSPVTDDLTLPKELIQKAYIDSYNLKDYIPTLMKPARLSPNCGFPLYYSLSFPTLLENSPYSKNPPSIIDDQRDIKRLLEILLKITKKQEHTIISPLENINFDLFHTGDDPYGQIKSSKFIPLEDQRFLEQEFVNDNKIFCSTSAFFIGCIKISWVSR